MSDIRMVVFDMAGTTVNEDNVVYKTLQKILAQNGIEHSLNTVLEVAAGKEKQQAIIDLIAVKHSDEFETSFATELYKAFRQELATAYHTMDVQSFHGTESIFQYLQGKNIKVVLNTGYDKSTAISLVTKLNWQEGQQFDLLVTSDDVNNGRPEPDMILLAMDKLDIAEADQVAKIGDSAVDIEEGKAAGCGLTMGITTGAQTLAQLRQAEPDYILEDISELAGYI